MLAILNSAAVNTGVHMSFCIIVFLGYMASSKIARSYGSSIFSFLRNLVLFSTVAVPAYIPTNRQHCFLTKTQSYKVYHTTWCQR